MKTDGQVLDEAISHLERDGVWCQGTWAKTPTNESPGFDEILANQDKVIGMCAEGAIRMAAEWFDSQKALIDLGPLPAEPIQLRSNNIWRQVNRIESLVANKLGEIRADVRQALVAAYQGGWDGDIDFPLLSEDNLVFSLHELNDHDTMRGSDIVLAMKHARAELSE